jgi:NAD-dependent deacetylase
MRRRDERGKLPPVFARVRAARVAKGGGDVTKVLPHRDFGKVELAPTERIFVLTGAGISAESGIRTFRDANGMWEEYRVEDVASPEGWREDPEVVWRFYSERRAQAKTCAPNPAHVALAELERRIEGRLFLCTQNVDPLHERAGSTRAAHMHGELFKSRCERPRCASAPFVDDGEYRTLAEIPKCRCGGRIRPHIVWFGEMPFELELIEARLSSCAVFVTVGSSGAVYPAAGLVRAARAHGARTIYVGPEAPDNASAFDECRLGKAGEALPGMFS